MTTTRNIQERLEAIINNQYVIIRYEGQNIKNYLKVLYDNIYDIEFPYCIINNVMSF